MRESTAKINRGFTLAELIIVVAIIAILASLAVSVYQTYTVRQQVADAINMAAHAKAPVVQAFNNTGRPPASRIEAGLTAAATDGRGPFVSKVGIVDGRIDITMGNSAHADVVGDVLSITPYLIPDGSVIWRCGAAPAPGGGAVLLSDGRSHTAAYLVPTLEARYMPTTCRP